MSDWDITDIFMEQIGYKPCPVCHKMTFRIFYDDDSNGGMDRYECINPECNFR